MSKLAPGVLPGVLVLAGCISTDNPVLDAGDGTPDITRCTTAQGVLQGDDYAPQPARSISGGDHPDVFYMGWSRLDERNDLRFPARGYSGDGFEDKLFVSRRLPDREDYRTWQLLPKLDDSCEDVEKIRIHSFDMAPDGESLYISMRRLGDAHLGIYRFDFKDYSFHRLTQDDGVDYLYPTYVGDDADTHHPILFVSKSVDASELPLNYGGPSTGILLDEYDRAPTPLIHTLDTVTGEVRRIGFNNSHQLEPIAIEHDGKHLVVFTQWEHQQTTNRFSLWKIQVDGSDNFTFFGQESATDSRSANVFQPREIASGPYAGYILMTEGRGSFIADGSVAMTKREDLDLRSDRVYLDRFNAGFGMSRNPEHYNGESMVYAYRPTLGDAYAIYLKDYPSDLSGETTGGAQRLVESLPDLHLVHPRSFYPPDSFVAAPGNGSIGDSRNSYTNRALAGQAGFLVQDLRQSDNGVQHQLDDIGADELRLQFFVPSHTFSGSQGSQAIGRLGWGGSPELSVPASGFVSPESDGSLGVIVKPGLYTWKVHKRFEHKPSGIPSGDNLWIPIRAERQEISFVPDRVNACNQCHQERSQFNIDFYDGRKTLASEKMQGYDLTGVPDITGYDSHYSVPDFHAQIMPLLARCAGSGCHDARDKLDLSNTTGWRSENSTWLTLVRGGHRLAGTEAVVPYIYNSINPTGFDDNYHPAPFLWSLLLGDDLSVPPDADHPNDSSRSLWRPGDYGATYDADIANAIDTINRQYDHTGAWTKDELQSFITYSSTQSMVGLSDRISFNSDSLSISDAAAQRAYQVMVKECFDCHNNHYTGGIDDPSFGLPLEKRFRSSGDLRQGHLRFVVDSHKAGKDDTAFSQYIWQSDINASRGNTLRSALDRIDFNTLDDSQLLVYAGCDALHTNVRHPYCLSKSGSAYRDIENWVKRDIYTAVNRAPTLDGVQPTITIQEYAAPTDVGPISWSDPDGDLAQLFINRPAASEHIFNDTMLALNYQDFTSAMVTTYAILGDRGSREFEFSVSDGQTNSNVQTVQVQVTTDYVVPPPSPVLPDFSAFFTMRSTGDLWHIGLDGKRTRVGHIAGYKPEWAAVYRRSDRGWLYFVDQSEQRIRVVDEKTAAVLFTIRLDHGPNRETDSHKQTLYLLWWRPAEGGRPGELQGLLESKQGNSNGDFYVGLGDGEPPLSGDEAVVVPEYRTRLVEADNAVSVYVWRQATFMTQIVGGEVDRLNVLNLVTGKGRNLADFSFEAKGGYAAMDYLNVRAVLVSEDGAFYGFNQDLGAPPTLFSFDPLERVQVQVPLPSWLEDMLSNPFAYGTPFVVVPERT